MKIVLAQSAGFCYGVRRAVELAEATAAKGEPCVMLGSIIHNQDMIDHLAKQGMGTVNTVDDVPAGSAVIIRSHGESRAVHCALEAKGAVILNATCPNVTHIHKIVSQAEEKGRVPVIVGTPDHPEVMAIAGWCDHPVVVPERKNCRNGLKNPQKTGTCLSLLFPKLLPREKFGILP